MTAILLLSLLTDDPTTITGKCISVTDGDTLWLISEGQRIKVRIHGIDTPELRQEHGHDAANALRTLIDGKQVQIVHRNKHSRDRLVGYVLLDGVDVGELMLHDGWAWHEKRFDQSLEYSLLELDARESRRGLWADDEPVKPWDWRKRQKQSR